MKHMRLEPEILESMPYDSPCLKTPTLPLEMLTPSSTGQECSNDANGFGVIVLRVPVTASVSLELWWTVEGPLTKQTLLEVVLESLVLMSFERCYALAA